MPTKITGFPSSSNEYDEWKKQGRTWKDGSWWEAETAPTLETIEQGVQDVTAQTQELVERVETEGITEPEVISKTPEIPSQISSPDLPESNAQTTIENYTNDYITQLEGTRKTLEAKYKSELDRITKEKESTQTKIDDLTSKTEGVLTDDVKPLLDPFRADLETSERARLKVEDNYFENQALTEELGGLLTQIQNDITATKDVTGLASIREPRISKAVEDATARVGVIEAVMAARNNQISQAYTLIDRSVSAITADRQDQLNYYNSILSFYDTQKDDEGNKLITLNKEEKDIVDSKIGLLESDMAQAQANADYIKGLMTNPDTASFMAKSGITLNDTPAEVQKKMAEQSNRDQVTDFTNEMKADGYEYVAYRGDRTDLVSFDVGEETLWFKAPAEEETVKDEESVQSKVSGSLEQITDIDTLLNIMIETPDVVGKVLNKGWWTGKFPDQWLQMSHEERGFISGIDRLVSTGTINSLIEAKAQGATFGALSDSELTILGASFSKIKSWEVKDSKDRILGYAIDETNFNAELNRIRESTRKLAEGLGAEVPEYNPTGIIDPETGETVNFQDEFNNAGGEQAELTDEQIKLLDNKIDSDLNEESSNFFGDVWNSIKSGISNIFK